MASFEVGVSVSLLFSTLARKGGRSGIKECKGVVNFDACLQIGTT